MDYTRIKRKQLIPYFKKVDSEKKDIQGLIIRGYKNLSSAKYLLLEITDVSKAKIYLQDLANKFVTNAEISDKKHLPGDNYLEYAVQIAFTRRGLDNLALDKNIIATFSREFKEGMTQCYRDKESPGSESSKERSTLLGDFKENDPGNWIWGNEENPVDCMIMLYAKDIPAMEKLFTTVYTNLNQGVRLVYTAETHELNPKNKKEHFGFLDGISQPIIKGLEKSDHDSSLESHLLNPGEFILGHRNEYNNYSPSPYVDNCIPGAQTLPRLPGNSDKRDLGKNGTYLVFRQMEQHVEEFWNFLYHNTKEHKLTEGDKKGNAIKLGAKMVGRWPDGQPLVTCQDGLCPIEKNPLNNFNYYDLDKDGTSCPFGAHIRRTNPRDQVHAGRGPADSLEMSKRHRMLRRGRSYGIPLSKDFNIDNILNNLISKQAGDRMSSNNERGVRGLHFICLVSDIARQYEFVQNVWANTPSFADLHNEVDLIISPRTGDGHPEFNEFTTPQAVLRNRYLDVPKFTTVLGGAYFFMPGIAALKFILK